MTHTSTRRRKHRHDPQGVAIGIALILVGLALFLFWSGLRSLSPSNAASDGNSAEPMAVNFPAPQLELTSVNGKLESLADFRQDVLLVNNWATWCPPCKAEMPTLESYYEVHAAQGFMIVAIEAGDGPDPVLQFAQSRGLQFQVWLDPRNAALAVFRNANLPNSYVIDRGGMVRYAWTGAISRDRLEKFVTPLLAQSN